MNTLRRRTYGNKGDVLSGKYQTAVAFNDYIYRSDDYGATWAQATFDSTRNWNSVAMSSDGKYQTAVASKGYIYRSDDFGITWVQVGISLYWFNIKMSSDGKYQIACSSADAYKSSDYGITWTKLSGLPRPIINICMSDDGKNIYFVIGNFSNSKYLFCKSLNSGVNYSIICNYSFDTWRRACMSCSSNGKYVLFGGRTIPVFLSTDYMSTYTTKASADSWAASDISLDGKYQIIVSQNGVTYYNLFSSDYGNSFVQTYNTRKGFSGVSMSNDGKYQTLVSDEYIYRTKDYGATWAQVGLKKNWTGVAINKGL